jgi:hypothetical protein
MRLLKFLLGASVASVVLLAAPALNAAPIPWATPSGSTDTYTYSNGNTDFQLFVPAGPGDQPVATDAGIEFFPTNFKAEAVGNGTFAAASASDTVRFQLTVKPGHQLTDFDVHEVGDYSILGTGAVQVSGTLVIANLDTGEELHAPLFPAPSGLTNGVTTGAAPWTADTDMPIPTGWDHVQVILDNILHAVASPGGDATIDKKFVGPGVTITMIAPEPASLSLLAIGGVSLLRRSRRKLA